jgi:hypothetical protein
VKTQKSHSHFATKFAYWILGITDPARDAVTACPIGNTERLVSCDEPRASAKGDFSGSALLRRFSVATGAVSGAFWREDTHPCIDAQPLSFAGGSGVSAEPLCCDALA